jgi:hypothetical protein
MTRFLDIFRGLFTLLLIAMVIGLTAGISVGSCIMVIRWIVALN